MAATSAPSERAQALEFIERNCAEYDQSRIVQTCHRHTSRKVGERHMEFAGHGEYVFVDFRELAVRQDFPLLKRLGHGWSPLLEAVTVDMQCARK